MQELKHGIEQIQAQQCDARPTADAPDPGYWPIGERYDDRATHQTSAEGRQDMYRRHVGIQRPWAVGQVIDSQYQYVKQIAAQQVANCQINRPDTYGSPSGGDLWHRCGQSNK